MPTLASGHYLFLKKVEMFYDSQAVLTTEDEKGIHEHHVVIYFIFCLTTLGFPTSHRGGAQNHGKHPTVVLSSIAILWESLSWFLISLGLETRKLSLQEPTSPKKGGSTDHRCSQVRLLFTSICNNLTYKPSPDPSA